MRLFPQGNFGGIILAFVIGNLGGGRHCVSKEGILMLRLQIFFVALSWAPNKQSIWSFGVPEHRDCTNRNVWQLKLWQHAQECLKFKNHLSPIYSDMTPETDFFQQKRETGTNTFHNRLEILEMRHYRVEILVMRHRLEMLEMQHLHGDTEPTTRCW